MADLRGFKKLFCFVFTLLGVLSCAWMGFIPAGDWLSAIVAYGIAMAAFNASSVFYDSLLPYVASGKEMDHASSLGFSLGYLGGGVLFLINVIMYQKPEWFGIADGPSAIKISFVTVAVWWMIFSLPMFKNVQEPKVNVPSSSLFKLTAESVRTLWATLKVLSHNKNLLFFIIGYWFYIDGVYTVMTMAVDYGVALGFETSDLITALLLTQFVGFPCTLLMGLWARRWSCRLPILLCIIVYSVGVILSTQMSKPIHFYLLAGMIGMAQGGVQALSRSLFGQMITPEKSGEYFGLFNLIGRFASILGPLVVAFGVTVSGSSRFGMMGLLVLFIIGGVLLYMVKEPERESL